MASTHTEKHSNTAKEVMRSAANVGAAGALASSYMCSSMTGAAVVAAVGVVSGIAAVMATVGLFGVGRKSSGSAVSPENSVAAKLSCTPGHSSAESSLSEDSEDSKGPTDLGEK